VPMRRNTPGDGKRQHIAVKAIRTCGGQSMLKVVALEPHLPRQPACGALMLRGPRKLRSIAIGRESLYEPGEKDEKSLSIHFPRERGRD